MATPVRPQTTTPSLAERSQACLVFKLYVRLSYPSLATITGTSQIALVQLRLRIITSNHQPTVGIEKPD